MRKTFIIVGAIVVVLGVGALIYYFFFAKPTVTTTGGTLPIAGQATNTGGQGGGSTPPPANTPVTVTPRLVRISAGPVVFGEVVTNREPANASSTSETLVSYIDRQSGNIYTYAQKSASLTRVSNKTVPGIQSAAWLPDGSLAYVRYLSGADSKTINTYALSSASTDGFFLPQDLSDVATPPPDVSASVLTLASGASGSTASLHNTDGSRPTQIFSTPLSSLRVSYAGRQYLAYTKPASGLIGNAYLVDTAGNFSRIAGPLNGLVALASPLGGWVLVSYAQSGTSKMALVNTKTNETLPLPVATIADKCAWAADDSVIYCGVPVNPPLGVSYPDDWYQGAVQFTDRIWKIQVNGRYAQLVLDFTQEAKSALDATALAVDPANSVLVFVNKNDSSLWSYTL